MSELETVWSGDRGVYIGACLRQMEGYTVRPGNPHATPVYAETVDALPETFADRVRQFVARYPRSTMSDISRGTGRHSAYYYRKTREILEQDVERGAMRVLLEDRPHRSQPVEVYVMTEGR